MPVFVSHLNETLTFVEMSKINKHNLTAQTIAGRWRKMGKPKVIGKSQYDKLMRERTRRTDQAKAKWFTVDGKKYSTRELSDKFQVSRTTILAMGEKYGYRLKSEMFVFKRVVPRDKHQPIEMPMMEKKEDRSPGWAERKYFPNTGREGYACTRRAGE